MAQSHEKNEFSRRHFMALSGSAVSLAALGGVLAPNVSTVNADTIKLKENEADVLVIGGGMAGLFAAVKAHDAGAKVLLICKGRLGSSGQTPFAKGIFAYNPKNEKMSLDKFTEAVSKSALGTNNPVYTRQMAEHSLARVNELKKWGFFDAPLCFDSFNKPIKERNISVKQRVMITHLVKENNRIAGAAGFSMDEEEVLFYRAKSVILCTGAGGFKPNGFPICDLTHDGTIMAYNIGAKVTGKEWNDGHMGNAEHPAACFDGWHGMFERTPSTTGIGIRHDLGVDLNYAAYKTGGPVSMHGPGSGSAVGGGPTRPSGFDQGGGRGPRPGGGEGFIGGFGPGGQDSGGGPPMHRNGQGSSGGGPGPGGREGFVGGFGPGGQGSEGGPPMHGNGQGPSGGGPGGGKEGGAPPGMGGTNVGGSSAGMAIHKSEGLVPINNQCQSTIPGLYAAGDALGSYMAGAIYTQIGSSLAGSAVQGAIAAEAAAKYCKSVKMAEISTSQKNRIQTDILAPLKRKSGYSPAWVTQTLQGVMIPNFVIYIKKESLLKAALAYVEELRDHHMPLLMASDMHELRLAHETANMITSAEMKLKASIMRKESRCSHYRLDYPKMDDQNWKAWINLYKGSDGTMQLEKQSFGKWPDNKKFST